MTRRGEDARGSGQPSSEYAVSAKVEQAVTVRYEDSYYYVQLADGPLIGRLYLLGNPRWWVDVPPGIDLSVGVDELWTDTFDEALENLVTQALMPAIQPRYVGGQETSVRWSAEAETWKAESPTAGG